MGVRTTVLSLACVAAVVAVALGFSSTAFRRPTRAGVRTLAATAVAPRTTNTKWSPESWRSYPIKQPPNYPDQVRPAPSCVLRDLGGCTSPATSRPPPLPLPPQVKVDDVVDRLSKCAPLVFAGEVRTLQEELARASMGQGFLLMGGDCAEAFKEFSVNHIRDTFRVILQMALVMSFGGSMPVIKVGRMAGQFAKPRSEPDEVIDGVALPSYRGDIINGDEFTLESRTHNPERMMGAYYQVTSAAAAARLP